MATPTYRQATKFTRQLLEQTRRRSFSFRMGPVPVTVVPQPDLSRYNLQFTDGDLDSCRLEIRIGAGPDATETFLYLSAGDWEGRKGGSCLFENGRSHFVLVHGRGKRSVHQLDLRQCLETAGGLRQHMTLVTYIPFPSKGGAALRERLTIWLKEQGLAFDSQGRLVLGTVGDTQRLLENLIALSLLKQHLRGGVVIPELLDELPVGDDEDADEEDRAILETMVREDLDSLTVEEDEAAVTGVEGRAERRWVNHFERNAELRTEAIRLHGTVCQGCGFDFQVSYGQRGDGFIEVHHLRPVSQLGGEAEVNPASDMAVLCANCHRIVHRRRNHVLDLDELRALTGYQPTASSSHPQRLQNLMALLMTHLPRPLTVTESRGKWLIAHADDLTVELLPTRVVARVTHYEWYGQTPVRVPVEPLVVRSSGKSAAQVADELLSALEWRLSTYTTCVDCGETLPPEQMSGEVCHSCGHKRGYVY